MCVLWFVFMLSNFYQIDLHDKICAASAEYSQWNLCNNRIEKLKIP